MTKLLEAALEKLAALPAEQQENIALLILKEIGKQIDDEPIEADELPSSIGMGASGMFDLSTHLGRHGGATPTIGRTSNLMPDNLESYNL